MLRIGSIVQLKLHSKARVAVTQPEWEKTGIIIDVMEMEDGFYYYECAFGMEIDWFQDLELEVVTK